MIIITIYIDIFSRTYNHINHLVGISIGTILLAACIWKCLSYPRNTFSITVIAHDISFLTQRLLEGGVY